MSEGGHELELLRGASQALAQVSSAKDAWVLSRTAEAARRYAQMRNMGAEAINYAIGIKVKAMILLAEFVDAGQADGTIRTADQGRPTSVEGVHTSTLPELLDTGSQQARDAVREARRTREALRGSEPGSDQLDPWIVLSLDKLRLWDPDGRKHRAVHNNKDRSSSLAVYWLEDIPRDVLMRSSGVPRQVAGSYEAAKTDRRFIPYTRTDDWAESSRVHPDTRSDDGWLCPQCGRNALKFYGLSPQFDPTTRRYVGPDMRVCRQCYPKAA